MIKLIIDSWLQVNKMQDIELNRCWGHSEWTQNGQIIGKEGEEKETLYKIINMHHCYYFMKLYF